MEVSETLGVVGYMSVEVGDTMVGLIMYWNFYMKSWDDASNLHCRYWSIGLMVASLGCTLH